MIRLTTLGALDLRSSDGTPVQSVLRQPRRCAILAYLALARPRGFQRRDRLLTLFWPELDRDRARHRLSQAKHYLRRSLGNDVVVGRGDEEIGIAPERLWCDVVAFDEALDRNDLEGALELYRGELLSGFHISDAPEFERWLDDERARLSKRAAEASWALAGRKGAAGDGAAATAWAKRAVSFAPWEEAGLRRLIALLDSLGDRAGAVSAYQEYARRLQLDLETEPAAETRELIESVKQRDEAGSTPPPAALDVAAPGEARGGAPRAPASEAHVPPQLDAGPRRPAGNARRWHPGRWAVVALVAIAAAVIARYTMAENADEAPPVRRLAVLPFVDQSANGENEHIAEALTTELIAQLHDAGKIDVISHSGVQRYRDQQPNVKDVGRELGVSLIVAGTVTGSDETIRVRIELVDAGDARMIQSEDIDESKGEVLSLVRRVTEQLEAFLRPIVGQEFRFQAWQAGTKSNDAWNRLKLADGMLTRASEYHGESDYVAEIRSLDHADRLLGHVRRLDKHWSEPVVMQARVAQRRALLTLFTDAGNRSLRREWLERADSFATSAIDLNERDAAAWEFRGTVRHLRFLLAPPSGLGADSLLDQAGADLTRSLALEADRPRAESSLSAVLFSQGRFGEALDAALRAYSADAYLTNMDEIVNRLFTLSFNLHEDEQAGQWCDEVRRRMPDRWPLAYCELVIFGWSTESADDARPALVVLETFGGGETEAVRALWRPSFAMLASAALVREGRADSARALVERARQSGNPHDPALLEYEAAARVKLGDLDQARALLRQLVRDVPTARQRLASTRFFEELFREDDAWLDR